MAFKDSSGNIVITDEGVLSHSGFHAASSSTLSATETKIKPSDGASGDLFGQAVAVGSGRIVATSLRDDDAGTDMGAAYIFDLDGNQLTKIPHPYPVYADSFGTSVAVGCGRIAIGDPLPGPFGLQCGYVYIFDLDGNYINQLLYGIDLERFGKSVAIGSDRIVVGAPQENLNGTNAGAAHIFNLDGSYVGRIISSDIGPGDYFGTSVAVGNGRVVVGAEGDDDNGSSSGSAYIFDLNGNEITKIVASDGATGDGFGISVAVGSGRIVVGAYNHGPGYGAAYIYDLNGNLLSKIVPSDSVQGMYFGKSVGVGSGRICVGAYSEDSGGSNSGAAYVFDLDGNELAKIKASDSAASDYFGQSVAVGNGRVVVGAYADDDNGSTSGSAYIYDLGENYNTYIENITQAK